MLKNKAKIYGDFTDKFCLYFRKVIQKTNLELKCSTATTLSTA